MLMLAGNIILLSLTNISVYKYAVLNSGSKVIYFHKLCSNLKI